MCGYHKPELEVEMDASFYWPLLQDYKEPAVNDTVVMYRMEKHILHNSKLSSYFIEYLSPQSYCFVKADFTKSYYTFKVVFVTL
jgi:hypothetical protein